MRVLFIATVLRQLFYVRHVSLFDLNYNYLTFSVKDETSGTSVDWAYDEFGIRLAYTFEFRDRGKFRHINRVILLNYYSFIGNYGFVLPADQIIPNGLEILDGIKAMVTEARIRSLL